MNRIQERRSRKEKKNQDGPDVHNSVMSKLLVRNESACSTGDET